MRGDKKRSFLASRSMDLFAGIPGIYGVMMTPEQADKAQQWAGMDGATAWHLIERHAENWNEVGEMMNAWLRANVALALDEAAEEEPINGNELAQVRVRMKAARVRSNDQHNRTPDQGVPG